VSSQEAEYWRDKSAEIQTAAEKAKLVRYNTFNKEFNSWQFTMSSGDSYTKEQLRKLLVSLGIDGAREDLGDDMVEIVFYNTSVLTPV
jgi:hypothetical protein